MMRPFTYHKPGDLSEIGRIAHEGSALLAGGQALLRDMKRGLRTHAQLIDVGQLLGRSVREEADTILIEAGATHAEVAASALVQARLPMLAGMVGHIADPLVRHRATIGGALAGNEPAGDYPAAALAFGATVKTSVRSIPAEALLARSGAGALGRGEVIVAVSFPVPVKAGYAKNLNPAARYALVGACAAIRSDGSAALTVTGASTGGAFRWEAAEKELSVNFDVEALAGLEPPRLTMREDLFADAAYRAHLVGVMSVRAVAAANGGATVRVYSHGASIREDHRQTSRGK